MGAKASTNEPVRRQTGRGWGEEGKADFNRQSTHQSQQPASIPRPGDNEVLAEFRAKLNSLPLREEQKLILQEQSVDVKHKLLCKLKELQMDDVQERGPSQLLQLIQDTPTPRSFRQLLKWLKTASDSSVVSFIDSNGIDVLINMLIVSQELAKNTKDYTKQLLILRCVEQLNKFEDGTLDLIMDELKVVYIALTLSAEDDASSLCVIDMLVDLCWYSSEGYEAVGKSIEVLALDKGLSHPLTYFLSILRSPSATYAFKHKAMTLLNTLIHSALEPEVQAGTRAKLLELGLKEIMIDLKERIAEIGPVRRRNVRAFQFETKRRRLGTKESKGKEEAAKAKKSAVVVFDPDNVDEMRGTRERRRSGEKLVKPSEELALDSKVNEIIHSTIDVSLISSFVERQAEADQEADDIADEDYALALLDQIQLFEDDEEEDAPVEAPVVPPTTTESLIKALEQSATEAGAHGLLLETLNSLLAIPADPDAGKPLWEALKGASEKISKKRESLTPDDEAYISRLVGDKVRTESEHKVDDLIKQLEARDHEIERLWHEKTELMEKENIAKQAFDQRDLALTQTEEKLRGSEEKRIRLGVARTQTVSVEGREKPLGGTSLYTGAGGSVPAAPALSIPAAPALSIPAAPSLSIPTAPALSIPSAPVLSIPSAPVLSIPSAPVLSIPSAPVLSIPSAPKLSIPAGPSLSVPTAPALSIPAGPSLSVPTAPALSIPSAPSLSVPTAPALSIPSAPSLSIPSAPSLNISSASRGIPSAPSLSIPSAPALSIPSAPVLSIPSAPSLSIPTAPTLGVPAAPSLSIPGAPKLSIPTAPNLSIPSAPSLSVPSAPSLSLKPGVPTAPALNLSGSAPIAPQLNLAGVPSAPQLSIPSAPGLSLKPGIPSAPSLNIGVPAAPALGPKLGAPAAPSLNLGTPAAPTLNLGAPAAPALKLGAPAAPKLGGFAAPAAPQLNMGVPSAPSIGPSVSAPSLSGLIQSALPAKAKRQPSTAMKSFFWQPIVAAPKILNSVWKSVDDTKIQIDEESLVALFAQKKQAPKAAPTEAAAASAEAKPSKISLYPKERSQNVQLLLGKLRMSNTAIVEALLRVDESVLTRGNLITLK